VGWRPSITRHLLTLGGDVHRSSLAHRIMHITAPRPAGIRPRAGTCHRLRARGGPMANCHASTKAPKLRVRSGHRERCLPGRAARGSA
jgi:hypothetical protein